MSIYGIRNNLVVCVLVFFRERELMSDESDEEMEVEGTVPPTTPTTPRLLGKAPKHDLMMTDEVYIKMLIVVLFEHLCHIYCRVNPRVVSSNRQNLSPCIRSKMRSSSGMNMGSQSGDLSGNSLTAMVFYL